MALVFPVMRSNTLIPLTGFFVVAFWVLFLFLLCREVDTYQVMIVFLILTSWSLRWLLFFF